METKEKYELLIEIINERFNSNLLKMDRKRENVDGRKVFYYLSKKLILNHISANSRYLGQDPVTGLHAIKTLENLMDVDGSLKSKVEDVGAIFMDRLNPRRIENLLQQAIENKRHWKSEVKRLKKLINETN